MENLAWLVVGIALGAVAVWVSLRALAGKQRSDDTAELERARAEAAQARTEAAEVRASAADARAALAGAEAQRDAAVQRTEALVADREQLVNQFKVLSAETMQSQEQKFDASAELRMKATEQLLGPVKESLARFNDRIGEVEKQRVELSTELRNQVAEVKLTGERLRNETSALVTALRKPQVRGTWGELQLRRVVELAGMVENCDFVQQQTTQTSSGAVIRPDLKVMLTGGRFIYVDSKVPLSAFLDAHEAPTEAERNRLLAQFARNVQAHVDQLAKKDYFKAEGGTTPEYVILFLGSEALAAEAFNQLPALLEYAAERGIMLASPSSLITTLKTAAFAWKQVALAESAKQVFDLGRELYDRLGTLGKHFDKVGRSLTSAVGAYNDAVGSIEGRVFPTARKLRDLKVTDKELEAVHPVDAAPRRLTAEELVEDATAVTPMIGRARTTELEPTPEADPILDSMLAAERPAAEPGARSA